MPLLPLLILGAGLTAATYTNPVFDEDFPDPTVLDAGGGWYYAYATQGTVAGKVQNVQVARTRDLVKWERMGDAMPVKPTWASTTQMFWAPDVHRRERGFFLYFSATLDAERAASFKKERGAVDSPEEVFCLGVATSSKPEGPFRDSGRPLVCGLSFVNIDPMAFDDARTGRKYLYWGSGFQPIRVQELAADGLSFKKGSAPTELVRADKGVPFQALVEGAWVVQRGGYYYLFYSGENCCHGPLQDVKYAALVARSRTPTGPFETLAQATGAPDSAVLRRSEAWIAPGHNSVFTDRKGQDWIAYHAIDVRRPYVEEVIGKDRSVRRPMLMDRLTWKDGWPRVEGGTPSAGPVAAPALTGK
ncbi:family 43 glycosylhydrolase [Corallococcus macrosporus]|uniref:Family 43 glycosylhydrolase n=1 Tax=Corallococcus macrosporus TaxID=35 RepID=A0ABS3DMW3_9BACT|nr:glycoside hydrolase family 43 protein [Corallococcus macrosporus]MBN8232661.1 family 43 glycosylhydrolase [Corallococcus macrosporus]